MKIRELEQKDKEKWIVLAKEADRREKKWAEQKFNSFLGSKKKKKIIVCEDKGRLVGFIGIKGEDIEERVSKELNNEFVVINWIAILPEYRKVGLGSKLIKECERYVQKWGKKGVWLGCKTEIIPFYERNGFRLEGKFVNEMGKEENLMVRRK